MIHILLPDSKINLTRAEVQPAAFADTGIPMLFHAAYERGAKKARCRVHLVGWGRGIRFADDGSVRRQAQRPGGTTDPVAQRCAR